MSRRNILQVVAIALLAVLFAGATGFAQKPVSLGVVTKPGSAQNICAEKFKALLEQETALRIRLYDDGSLGDEIAILKQIQAGELHLGIVTSGPFDAFLPNARVIDYPFLFENYEQADRTLDGAPGRALLKSLEKAGFKGLAFSENGFRNITSVNPVHRADDVVGLPIRVMQSVIHQEIWKELGAKPVPLGWPINRELQDKTVLAQENPLSAILFYNLYEYHKHLVLTRHVYSAHIAVANLAWFASLSASDQKAVKKAMREAAQYERNWNRAHEAEFLEKLKKAGMTVDEAPDRDSFRRKLSAFADNPIFQDAETAGLLKQFMEAR